MIEPAIGSRSSTNTVSCHDMKSIIDRHTMIMIGSLKSMSRVDIIEFSISATSPVMRAITSPFLSVVKNPMGRSTILSYT